MGWDGEPATGGDFANRQVGFLQHAADFIQLAAAETLVYDNRFNPRTIYYQDMRESRLVGLLTKEPAGQDGWTRANIGTMKAVVRDNGGNQSLTFGDGNGNLAYALHDIGTLHKSGRLTTQVDACPPSGWRGICRARVWNVDDACV